MAKKTPPAREASDIFTEMMQLQSEAAQQIMQTFAPGGPDAAPGTDALGAMGKSMMDLQAMWLGQFAPEKGEAGGGPAPMSDPAAWLEAMQQWSKTNPLLDPERQHALWRDGLALWQQVLDQYQPGADGATVSDTEKGALPRSDRRFADPAWRDQPVYALIHQTYLLLAERISEAVDSLGSLTVQERAQLRFTTTSMLDAMSPANFPMMNPVVLERTVETGGENLIKGMERLTKDLEQGQLTHTDTESVRGRQECRLHSGQGHS